MGPVVLVLAAGCHALAAWLSASWTHDSSYYGSHALPRLAATAGAAVSIFLVARQRAGQKDSLFSVPLPLWAFIIFLAGLPLSFIRFTDRHVQEVKAKPVPIEEAVGRESANPKVLTAPKVSAPPADIPLGFKLQGIFYRSNAASTAIVNSQTVDVGDRVNNYTVIAIGPDTVTLRSPFGKERVLKQGDIGR